MEGFIEVYMLVISWVILFYGILILTLSPKLIFNCEKVISSGNPTKAERNEKSKDKQRLLDYYLTAGITLIIIGFLLVLIFSNKVILTNF